MTWKQTLKSWMHDDALHALQKDPDFDVRPTIPCGPPHDTIPCPPPADSAPVVSADNWDDGWI